MKLKIDPKVRQALVQLALDMRQKAYAPYSKYTVGAALLLSDGTIMGGCNVENASYSLSICAERVAALGAIASGRRDFVALAVATSSEPPGTPCGACRQFLSEFLPDLPIILVNDQHISIDTSLDVLLPQQFSKEQL